MQETQVQSLGQEDPVEKEMATHSNILAWGIHGQKSLADYRESDVTKHARTKPSKEGALCTSLL